MFRFATLLLATAAFAVPSQRAAIKVDTLGNGRIVGGYTAVEGQFPYQVSIRLYESHHCGGSILDATTVISAAHCFSQSASDYTVVAGSNHISNGGDSYPVTQIRVHEWFNPASKENDIAIVKLSKPIVFNNRVQPVALESYIIDKGVPCILSGWGATSYPGGLLATNLQYLNVYSVGHDDCKAAVAPSILFKSQLCTFIRVGQGGCVGDSGGPLATSERLVGIVSWGFSCALGYPDVFTRVSSFLGWIENNRH